MHFKIIGLVTGIETIATGTRIREWRPLRKVYGPGRWRKRKGFARIRLSDGTMCQVASGDWGTPSEYLRELIRQDKERRLAHLEQDLLSGAKGRKIELRLSDIRKKGLVRALRERAARK